LLKAQFKNSVLIHFAAQDAANRLGCLIDIRSRFQTPNRFDWLFFSAGTGNTRTQDSASRAFYSLEN